MDNRYKLFYDELQTLFGSRLLRPNEIRDYMQFVESSSMEKNAFIAIVQYCIGIKGSAISSTYILKVATDFAQKGVLTLAQLEKALSEKSNGDNSQKEESSSQEEYLINLFRKLNPRLKKNVIDIVKGLTTSLDNK